MTVQSNPLPNETSAVDPLKIRRQEKIIEKNIEEFLAVVDQMNEQKDLLTLEVEELKKARNSFKNDLQKTLTQELVALAPSFSKSLSETFDQRTSSFIEGHLKELGRLQQETGDTIFSLQSITTQSKYRTTLIGIALVVASCFSCFVMAVGLYYFFPSHYEVKYETSKEQFKEMLYGKVLMNTFKSLKPDDQNLVLNAMEATIRQMGSTKP